MELEEKETDECVDVSEGNEESEGSERFEKSGWSEDSE